MRKFLAIVLALVLCMGLFGCAAEEPVKAAPAATAAPAEEAAEAAKKDVVILYTNDVHTYIDGVLSYDVIAALKDELEKEYEMVLLVDAGDHVQGTAYGSMDKGASIIELMNAAGYDLATLGNHEFDYGMDGAMNIIDWADFPYTSCNFYHEKDGVKGEAVLEAAHIFDYEGTKVAFVGITTPESFTKSTPAYFQDEMGNYIYGISGGEDGSVLYADVQLAIDTVKDQADYVIALGHLGDDPASQPWTSEETIAKLSGMDAFIDGHSHSTVEGKNIADKTGKNVLLTQTGQYFDAIGMMIIDGENGEITTDLITYEEVTVTVKGDDGKDVTKVVGYRFVSDTDLGAEWLTDARVTSVKDAWIEQINAKLGENIGSTSVVFHNYSAEN